MTPLLLNVAVHPLSHSWGIDINVKFISGNKSHRVALGGSMGRSRLPSSVDCIGVAWLLATRTRMGCVVGRLLRTGASMLP